MVSGSADSRAGNPERQAAARPRLRRKELQMVWRMPQVAEQRKATEQVAVSIHPMAERADLGSYWPGRSAKRLAA